MIKKENIVTLVEEAIKNYILEKNLKAASPLPSEKFLCEQFQVSRATLREALKKLSATGYIETRHGIGHFVGCGDIKHVTGSLFFSIQVGRGNFKDILDVRVALENQFIFKAMGMISDQTLDILQKLLEDMKEEASKMKEHQHEEQELILLHRDFHKTIYKDLDNIFLIEFIDIFAHLQDLLNREEGLHTKEIKDFLKHHDNLYHGLKKKDKKLLSYEMSHHFDELRAYHA